jgi:hypothetical protein
MGEVVDGFEAASVRGFAAGGGVCAEDVAGCACFFALEPGAAGFKGFELPGVVDTVDCTCPGIADDSVTG